MDESKILSTEEVDALSKVAQESESDLTKIINTSSSTEAKDKDYILNTKIITNILELTWTELEKIFTTFIKLKVNVRYKDCAYVKLSDHLKSKPEKYVYSIFNIAEGINHCLIMTPMPLLHQMLNCLYGGTVSPKETPITEPGKIGVMVSDTIAKLGLEGFANACKEYKKPAFNTYKTVTMPNLITKLEPDDFIYAFTYTIEINESLTEMLFVFPENFIDALVPIESLKDANHNHGNTLWRDLIKSQLVDSDATLVANIPQVPITTHDLIDLKVGDSIPITDPTFIEIYLNGIKLFAGLAGQANGTRIIKIIGDQ